MNVLGIETSCDENSVAVVKDGRVILSNVVYSQVDLHKMYGGVVPEVAARSHIEIMVPVIAEALDRAFGSQISKGKPQMPAAEGPVPKVATTPSSSLQAPAYPRDYWDQIDIITVANGPGLGGSLLIGTLTARALALIKNKPLYAVHHALGHVYANFIEPPAQTHRPLAGSQNSPSSSLQAPASKSWNKPAFPLLALIVSGGHSHLVLMRDHFDYQLLGQTQDDAVGEAFDKVAKVIGLEYPGGPSIEKAALSGDPGAFKLPKSRMPGYDFSFSGLKTAVLRQTQALCTKPFDFPSAQLAGLLSPSQVYDIAASFQRTAVEMLVDNTIKAYREFNPKTVVIAGGVAANSELRRQLADRLPIGIQYAPINLCTDNGAMIASLGYYKSRYAKPQDIYSLDINPSLTL